MTIHNDLLYSDLAQQYGTPLYVYDERVLARQAATLAETFPESGVLFSIKSNPCQPVLASLCRLGIGADAASAAEVALAHRAGMKAADIFYSAPGKSLEDLQQSLGKATLIADSYTELQKINNLCRSLGVQAQVGLRINPDFTIDHDCRELLSGASAKFGVDSESLAGRQSLLRGLSHVAITGIHIYTRSQVSSGPILLEYMRRVLDTAVLLQQHCGCMLEFINFGGGFALAPSPDSPGLDWNTIAAVWPEILGKYEKQLAPGVRLLVESGRFLAGPAGVYLSQVLDVKTSRGKEYAIVGGGLNGFLRAIMPALADRFGGADNLRQSIEPLYSAHNSHPIRVIGKTGKLRPVELVGNLCTGLDVLGSNLMLPLLEEGDLICIHNAGAYAASISPFQFSSQKKPVEVFVDTQGAACLV